MYSIKIKREDRAILTIISLLFFISLFLITYDKLPFLRYSSYSPSSIFTFFTAFVFILIIGYKYSSYEKWLWIFIVLSIIRSLISGVYFEDLSSSFSHIITLIVGISVFVTTKFCFNIIKGKVIKKVLIISIIPPLMLGYLQLLNQINLNVNFVDTITSYLAFYVYEGRIQMGSSEPSWAVIHLMTIGVVLFYDGLKNNKLLIFLIVFLFVMIFSSLGYGVLLFSLILFGLITKRYRLKVIFGITVIIGLVFIIVPLLLETFNIQGYFDQRFDFRYLFSHEFLMNDESGFVRVVFPIIGVMQFLDFPFGYGGGFYYVNFPYYLLHYFPYGLEYNEVMENIRNEGVATARNLFAKLLSEEGIVGITLFLLFLIGLFKKIKSVFGKYVFCLSIAFLINFDSYAFVNFWFLLGVISSGYFNKRVEE